jgi:hypothetical protein
MNTPNTKHPLPLPRLILRLGGLGNRKFGNDNGIAEAPGPLLEQAKTACEAVLVEVEQALLSIHHDALQPHTAQQGGNNPSWWQTHVLACLFGKPNRWGFQRGGTRQRVFSDKAPLVQLLTDDAEGGDTLIRTTGLARPTDNVGKIDYQYLRVAPVEPTAVPDGLGVGKPTSKNDAIEKKIKSETPLSRAEAHEQATIARKRAHAYRAQSEALRHHSDILLAIWDPDTEGKAGGTSETVEAALQERIPVIAIRLIGAEKADVRLLETPRHLQALQCHSTDYPAADWQTELRRVLHYLLSFPDAVPEHGSASHESATAYQPRAAFAAFRADEPLLQIRPARAWRRFDTRSKCRALEAELHNETDASERAYLEKELAKAREALAKANWHLASSHLQSAVTSGAAPDYQQCYGRVRARAASSGMSGIYGDAHRGGIILSYRLAAFAVALAIGSGILHVLHASHWLLAIVALAELGAISMMYALATVSRTEGWNSAYADSRILAEALRMMEFLAPLGVHTPLPRLPYYLQKSEDATNPDRSWAIWYFRALVRMAPLRLGPLDLEAARRQIQEQANLGQRRYHKTNATKQSLLHHRIETVVPWIFLCVFFYTLLHLIDVALPMISDTFGLHLPGMFEVGLVIGVGGPALIAALHGFASQIEINRLQLRSSSMQRLLEERSNALQALVLTPADEAEAVWGLANEALATASLLMDETAGWSMLYRNSDIHAG